MATADLTVIALGRADTSASRYIAEIQRRLERQAELVVQHDLTRQAELATEDIIDNAHAEEREIRLGAETYADEILSTLESGTDGVVRPFSPFAWRLVAHEDLDLVEPGGVDRRSIATTSRLLVPL